MRGLLVVAVVVGSVGLAFAEPVRAKKAVARATPASHVWSAKRAAPSKVAPRKVTRSKGKGLRTQGMTAYKAGNYNAAVTKFAAAMETSSSPELLYQSAQAYRLKGERGKALDLYEQYLEQAPDGSAAPVCRWYVERLSATP